MPKSSLDTVSALIINNGAADALSRFFSRGARKIFEPRTLESFTSYNHRSLCTKICLQNARSPSAQNSGDALRKKMFRWKGTSYNSILVVIDQLTPVMTRTGLRFDPRRYRPTYTSYDSDGIAYVYQLEEHQL